MLTFSTVANAMLEIQCSYICVLLGRLQWSQFCSAATPPATKSTETTTGDKRDPPFTGVRGLRLSEGALWGIIGGCIAFVIIVYIIILVCLVCTRKSKIRGTSKRNQFTFHQ